MRAKVLASLAVLLLLLAAPAFADVLTLHNGAQLEGKLVEQRPDEVVFEHVVSGAHVRSVFAKADVAKLELDYGTRSAPANGGVPATNLRYPELKDLKKKVALVIDRSGSMAIGDRWLTALDEVEKLLAELPEDVSFSVYTFDRKATPLTEANFVKPTDESKRALRAKLDKLGVNLEGYTDLAAGLAPAIAAEPEAIYLFSDGVPTIGEPSASAVWKGIKEKLSLLPPPKSLPIHVVGLAGGTYEFGDPENADGARLILRTIAESTGAKYRELKAVLHGEPRALKPVPELAPRPDAVTFHFFVTQPAPLTGAPASAPVFNLQQEFFQRQFVNENLLVAVEDPALQRGPLVLEYATSTAPRIELESYAPDSVSKELFDEKRDLEHLVPYVEGHNTLDNGQFQQIGSATVAHLGVLRLYQAIHLVRGLDERKQGTHSDDASTPYHAFIKVHSAGGTLHVIYKRGNKSFKHVFFIDPLVSNGGGVVVVDPATPQTPAGHPAGAGSNKGHNQNGGH
jgi:hypothetical protein